MPACRGTDRGAILTTIFGNFESIEIKAVPTTPTPKKKRGWLPLLTILFMISYGLMTMLIVEQGQTIESQRALIRELFRDSTELSGVKMKAQEERRIQALAQQNPSIPNPVVPDPVIPDPVIPESLESGANDPSSYDPGACETAGPVFPGGSTTSCTESVDIEVPGPDTFEAGVGSGRSPSLASHDLRSRQV